MRIDFLGAINEVTGVNFSNHSVEYKNIVRLRNVSRKRFGYRCYE